ncbi:PP2C family protein-serine/threonine phosphatase [Streptomyces sp. NPDC060194]|uniref:PP2C family protein-serine/threonine phosphatase n=1 Tax=Streptomyces sp. NPDC060194 TaxID=3347069 RepID=UPI0036672666
MDVALQQALTRLLLLANAGDALGSTLDLAKGLRRLGRSLVPGLADWCAVDLLEGGRLRRVVVEHRDADALAPGLYEGLLPPPAESSASLLARALRGVGPILETPPPPRGENGEDPLLDREQELYERFGAASVVVAPLTVRRQVVGVLTLARATDTGALDQHAMPLVAELAHRVALAVDNASLHAQVQRMAERMQRSLLPVLPDEGPLRMAARYQPAVAAAEVGGDWYDAFVLPRGATTLIIGDLAGHDLKAAVAMGEVRNMLRGIACDRKEPPGRILARLDAAHHLLHPQRTLTCIYALVEKAAPAEPWTLQYAVAGHPPPLVVTPDGDTRYLEGGRGPLLGVAPDLPRPDATAALPPESTVVLYTDGLIERRGEEIDRGATRLRQHAAALAREDLDVFCDELMSGLASGSADDVALIAVRVPAEDDPPATART